MPSRRSGQFTWIPRRPADEGIRRFGASVGANSEHAIVEINVLLRPIDFLKLEKQTLLKIPRAVLLRNSSSTVGPGLEACVNIGRGIIPRGS